MSSFVVGDVHTCPPRSDSETTSWMEGSFPLVGRNLDRILAATRAFWSVPPTSRIGFSFGGSFAVPIGIWALGWNKGIGVYACEHCGARAFTLRASGSLSRGFSEGFCSGCGKSWHGMEWSIGIWSFLRGELIDRIGSLNLCEGRYPESFDFRDLALALKSTGGLPGMSRSGFDPQAGSGLRALREGSGGIRGQGGVAGQGWIEAGGIASDASGADAALAADG